jgi:hypothetical protein
MTCCPKNTYSPSPREGRQAFNESHGTLASGCTCCGMSFAHMVDLGLLSYQCDDVSPWSCTFCRPGHSFIC